MGIQQERSCIHSNGRQLHPAASGGHWLMAGAPPTTDSSRKTDADAAVAGACFSAGCQWGGAHPVCTAGHIRHPVRGSPGQPNNTAAGAECLLPSLCHPSLFDHSMRPCDNAGAPCTVPRHLSCPQPHTHAMVWAPTHPAAPQRGPVQCTSPRLHTLHEGSESTALHTKWLFRYHTLNTHTLCPYIRQDQASGRSRWLQCQQKQLCSLMVSGSDAAQRWLGQVSGPP
jgi:hypothetical protein